MNDYSVPAARASYTGNSSLIMLGLLGVLVFVYNLGAGIYVVYGLEPSPTLEFLYQAGFICGVIWWLRADARRSAVQPIYCPGLLVGAAWIVIIPYHLVKTRGARGLIPLFALIGSFVLAHIATLVLYVVLLMSNQS